MIELYIENKKIDITDDLEINFTYESIDPDKLSSIKNSFSKTVNIPGTAANNITFGHIFRYDKYIPLSGPVKIDNYYDPHKKVNWFINKNGALINRGYCTLDNILVKSERNITYQLTLYGGIGEFFYSLTYNEDGSTKTLYDMFWNWRPKTTVIGHGDSFEPGEENSNTLFKCSADIVASSYHTLNPLYTYEGTTDIEKDVVFVPCYTGIYDNFDSKHMLVSTFNQHYNPGQGNEVMSTETKDLLSNSFPDTYTDDEGTYTTIDKNFSSSGAYKYGLVTFSRDIDPFEAGDLRVNELPVAIRLSKLMTVISNPYNNGGYEVEWDDEIKQSYHWLYSWILLGKIRQDKEDLNILTFSPNSTYDGYELTATYKSTTNAVTATNNYIEYNMSQSTNSLEAGTYYFSTYVNPKFIVGHSAANFFDFNYYLTQNKVFSGSYYNVNYGNTGWHMRQVWNMNVVLHRIYSDSSQTNLTSAHIDIFYLTQNEELGKPHYYPFGYNIDIKNSVKNAINSKFSLNLTVNDVTIHNCNFTKDRSDVYGSGAAAYAYSYFSSPTEEIKFLFTQNSSTSNFSVKQDQILMFSVWQSSRNAQSLNTGIYGEDNPGNYHNISAISTSKTGGSLFSCISSQQKSIWENQDYNEPGSDYGTTSNFTLSFEMNDSMQNGVLTAKNSGFNIISLDKKTLFANSESPMKYLAGYCKLMNYKFICNETEKKIQIKPLKKYYLNRVINLDERVDLGRDINIKNVTTKYKTLNIGLDSVETYPIYLFNKISREKFNIKRYDTGIEYNATESSLLNDIIFKNTLEWQQSSIFYNIYPQFPRAYDTMSISWTLFDTTAANVNDIKKKEIFTIGTPSTNISLLANVDFLPKIALFDKDNKAVDLSSSLIFLNGFVKNYDYTQVGSNYVISPRVSFSNDMYEQYYLNQERCYMYDFKYNDIFTSWGCYSNDQKGTASSWILPMFSRDLYNIYVPDIQAWNGTLYKMASWNFVYQQGLDNQYNLIDTEFIYNPNYNYLKTTTSAAYTSNEYKVNEVPQDDEEYTERIYDKNWKEYLDDLYDRNTRDVTAYVDLSGLGDAKSIMRYVYSWKSHLWVITKLYNFKIAETLHDKFTKVTMHKINNLNTWTN